MCHRGCADIGDRRRAQGDLRVRDGGNPDRVTGYGMGERLETCRDRNGYGSQPRSSRPPAMPEPAKQGAREDAADDHTALGDQERSDRLRRQVSILDWAERHYPVAGERTDRAAEAE